MRWPFGGKRGRATGPDALRRTFITPEGVDLRLELGAAGARAAAFALDVALILTILVIATIVTLWAAITTRSEILLILWLIGAFLLRNGWFVIFEMSGRGATPGKRAMGLRVVARDGARLTAGAVIARNALREIELFLPLSFLAAQTAEGTADAFLALFALAWSGIFLFFPLFNRDRLRAGDLVAGTWVIHAPSAKLAADLGHAPDRARRHFPEAALALYGVYELQTLEDVLRGGRPAAVATVAATIRHKANIPDDGDDMGFLTDYYLALCARLESGLLVGRRRQDKFGT